MHTGQIDLSTHLMAHCLTWYKSNSTRQISRAKGHAMSVLAIEKPCPTLKPSPGLLVKKMRCCQMGTAMALEER